jgi:hypothetical protein
MAFAESSLSFLYKVSYKNPSPALPIYLFGFTALFSSIADFGGYEIDFFEYWHDIIFGF